MKKPIKTSLVSNKILPQPTTTKTKWHTRWHTEARKKQKNP